MSTTLQIIVLIALILSAALLYWTGYRGGLIDGRVEGIDEGKAIQKSDSSAEVHELQQLLDQARNHHAQLHTDYGRALAQSTFGEHEKKCLLAMAQQLKLAADTFRSLKSEQEIRALELSQQALTMAALLEPVAQERAA